MNDDELDNLIKRSFNKNEENPFKEKIDDLIINLNRKRKIRKNLLFIMPFLLLSTTVIAIAYTSFNLKSVGMNEFAINLAIQNGYVQEINNDYQTYNGLSVKIDKILMDDINLDISFNFKSNEINEIDAIKNINIGNLFIYDENNNILYDYKNQAESIAKIIGYTKIEKETNDSFNNTFFALSEDFPHSQKLYIEFNSIILHNSDEDISIDGLWKFEIDVLDKMVNRTEDVYKCNDSNIVGDITLGSLKITETGSLLEIKSDNEGSLNRTKLVLKANDKKYDANNNIISIVSDKTSNIIRFIPFTLSKYDSPNKVTIEINVGGKKQEVEFIKQ